MSYIILDESSKWVELDWKYLNYLKECHAKKCGALTRLNWSIQVVNRSITMDLIDGYPSIKKTLLNMAYDNGCINRNEPPSLTLSKADKILKSVSKKVLSKADFELGRLTSDELLTFYGGDEADQKELSISRSTHDLFDDLFNNM